MARLEICCFDAPSAFIADEAGADRIELCKDRELGGTTPPLAWLEEVKSHVKIPVRVMIRPRGGDFVYSDDEFATMMEEIASFHNQADGFVFGVLTQDRHVDVERTRALVQKASPRPCTFHRAIDESEDIIQALDDIIETGCDTVLTSGGHGTSPEGIHVLHDLVARGDGRIDVMPGGGVRADNINLLYRSVAAPWYHSSAALHGLSSPSVDQITNMKRLLQTPENKTTG